jgi:hypothetical protein
MYICLKLLGHIDGKNVQNKQVAASKRQLNTEDWFFKKNILYFCKNMCVE